MPSWYNAANLMRAARVTTGLSDFGNDDFLEPLDLLIEGYHDTADLNAKGWMGSWVYLHRMLCNRLRLNRYVAQHNLDATQIAAPVFILGLPRTGSTLLHELLAAHTGLRGPKFWEATFVPGKSAFDQVRKGVTGIQIQIVDGLSPNFRSVHALGTHLPHECITLQALSFRSMQFHAAHNLQAYNHWLNQCDWQPAYQYHRHYLAWLQHEAGATRWVLKAPGHLLSLPTLLATYPDARIIQLHRDPSEVIPSMASLFQALRTPFTNRMDLNEIGRDVSNQWRQGLEDTMAFRDANPALANQVLDVNYADLVGRPLGALEQILAFVDLPFDAAAEQTFKTYLAANPKGKHGKHHYSPEQFGLNAVTLQQTFASYNARYLNPKNH